MAKVLLTKHADSLRQPINFDDWTSRVQSICGRYQPMQHDKRSVVLGHVGVLQAGGKAKCFDAHFAGRFQWRRDHADFVDPYAASTSCQGAIAAAKNQ